MIFIGVDLGYMDSTTVAIVDPVNARGKFQFRTIGTGLELDGVIERVIKIAREYNADPKNIYVPAHPAVEQKIRFALKHSVGL